MEENKDVHKSSTPTVSTVQPQPVATPQPVINPAPQPQPVATPQPQPPTPSQPIQPYNSSSSSGGSRAYLVEYLLSLVMTGTLVGILISFFSSIVSSIGASDSVGGWAARYAYTSSLATLSASIVFVVALFLVSKRCIKTEEAMPMIKQNKWRKGFLAVFLVLIGISTLTAATTMIYSIVSLVASIGVVEVQAGDTVRSIVSSIFAFGVLASTLLLYSQDYRVSSMNPRLERLHHWGLIVGVISLGILFMAFPLRNHRDAYIDGIASSDIRTLQREVNSYARNENKLPSSLGVLDAGDKIEGRIDNYEYSESDDERSYELCAEFRTDTTDGSSSGNPLEDALMSSGFGTTRDLYEDPSYHEKGRQCFEFEAPITSIRDLDAFDDYGEYRDRIFQ